MKTGTKKPVIAMKKTSKQIGVRPILSGKQNEMLKKAYAKSRYTSKELAEKFKISLPTLYRYLKE